MTYLQLLILEAKRLEELHESEITEGDQNLLNDLAKELELEQLKNSHARL